MVLGLAACAGSPETSTLPGAHSCESFFIYIICVGDIDENGDVDYMYFGDDYQIFMYASTMREPLNAIGQPWHPCVIPMSESTRQYSSQLLYDEDLGLADRLGVKGKLIQNYRASQAAVEACNAQRENPGEVPDLDNFDDPFIVDDDWEEGVD